MLRGAFEGWHIIILIVVLVALFGAKRLPDAARSLGRSARVFRSEVDEMKREAKKSDAGSTTVPGETVPPTTPTSTGTESPIQENAPRTDNSSGPVA
jgi:sec-independent protein translocase protein TatA